MIRTALLAVSLAYSGTAALAQGQTSYPLVEGVKVDLGEGWDATAMQNPAMKFPEARDLLADAQEIRFKQEGTGILVSTQTWKPINGKSLNSFDIADNAKKIGALYLPLAVESAPVAETRTNGGVSVALVTLHARQGRQFNVRAGYPGGCVSAGNVRKGWTIMSVSIASVSCDSETHRTALAAFLGAHE